MQSNSDILARLKNDIGPLQGYKPAGASLQAPMGLGAIAQSFQNAIFPFAALHEFYCNSQEETATSSAFLTGILSSQLGTGGIIIWIGHSHFIFPPALAAFGVRPDQFLFVALKKEREVFWVVEEALKCAALTSVVCEICDMSFTESRRLQLAIEKSGVSCFVLRNKPRNLTTAATARWHIKPLPSLDQNGLPGVGYPRWQVDLLKVRNGKPGSWHLEWAEGHFRQHSKLIAINGYDVKTKVS